MGASVRARLLTLAKERRQPNDLLLTRYALERFLYRLSTTRHRDRFVLKGAMLMTTWFETRSGRRATSIFSAPAIPNLRPCSLSSAKSAPSRWTTASSSMWRPSQSIGIREEHEYGGLRIKTNAAIAGARVRVVIDIGFGDATEPGAAEIDLPVLLDLPGAAPARLSARDGHRREIPGDGGAWPGQQPYEGPLRYLASVARIRIQGRRPCARHRRDFRAAEDTGSRRAPFRSDQRLRRRPRQARTMECLCRERRRRIAAACRIIADLAAFLLPRAAAAVTLEEARR